MKSLVFSLFAIVALTCQLLAQTPAPSSPDAILVKPNVLRAVPLLDPESVPLAKPLESNDVLAGKPEGADAVRLQIFLDQSNFGPGVIDGKPGLFTEHAVMSWNEVNGHPLTDWVTIMNAAREAVKEPLITATVPDIIAKWVNSKLPNDRIAQSKTKRLSYRSVAELMAERYHTDVDFLIDTNGAQKVYSLKAGSELIVPNVSPFEIEKIAGIQHPRDEVKAQRHVVVDTKRNQVRIFEAAPVALVISEDPAEAAAPPKPVANRSLIASFPITPGKPQFIHRGMWEMRTCVEFPSWRYDKLLLETGKRSKDKSRVYDLPSGPNSPVGVIWCGLSKSGIGLHGTADPETIGRAQSAGCIRLANWDAIRLPTLVSPGSSVEIR
jgi:lipoprotein-anchoring transpeptidase ErfK/SrfK